MRLLAAYTVIFVVLVCPLFCMSEATGSTSSAPQPKKGCCSCNSEDSQDVPPTPETSVDCLCHGAIFAGVRPVEFDDIPLAVEWIGSDSVGQVAGVFAEKVHCSRPHHRPPASSGREICALICARLL